MAFNNRSDQSPMSEINVTPLVDVMLVLLVVFIVTAPLLTQSIGVNLPRTVAASPTPATQSVMISIDAAGDVYLDKEKLTMDTLGPRLTEKLSQHPDLTVQFEVDEKVSYGKAAEALAIAQHSGITNLSLQTRP